MARPAREAGPAVLRCRARDGRMTEASPMRRLCSVLAAMALLLAVATPAAATRGQPTLAVPFHLQMTGVDRPLQMAPGGATVPGSEHVRRALQRGFRLDHHR